MGEHTPTPWGMDEDGTITGPGGGAVAFVVPYAHVPTALGRGEEFCRADAELIVRAVNAHAALAAAAGAARVLLDVEPRGDGQSSWWACRACGGTGRGAGCVDHRGGCALGLLDAALGPTRADAGGR